MELDDLKQTWKQTHLKKDQNTDIMELIQHKSYGPVSALKRTYRKQILLMGLLPFFLLATNFENMSSLRHVLTSVIFWAYVVFCIGVVIFATYNYRIAAKMENLEGDVRSNLSQQISILEQRSKWELIGIRCALLFFILLTEIVPYFQHYRMLDKWHALSPAIRFGTYAGLLTLQYFLNQRIRNHKVGRHLNYLKRLLNEMK